MSCLIWNAHGVSSQSKVNHIKTLVFQQRVNLLVILEPKLPTARLHNFAWKLGFPSYLHGEDKNQYIWILWKTEIDVQCLNIFEQAITVSITTLSKPPFTASFVYASCSQRSRKDLWAHLSAMNEVISDPWFMGGDFNATLDVSEKKGGLNDVTRLHDFQNFVIQSGLLDAGFIGNPFTWSNNQHGTNRVWSQLDRVLVNSTF
ncbi:hypothetical protein ACP275_14G193900 [Erythranthe tilingii]